MKVVWLALALGGCAAPVGVKATNPVCMWRCFAASEDINAPKLTTLSKSNEQHSETTRRF